MSKPQLFTIFSAAASAQRRRKKALHASQFLTYCQYTRLIGYSLCTCARLPVFVLLSLPEWSHERGLCRGPSAICADTSTKAHGICSPPPAPASSVSGGDSQLTCHCWSQSQRESWSHTLPFFHSSNWFFNFFSPRPTFLIHRLSQQLSWNDLADFFASLPLYLSLVFSQFLKKKSQTKLKIFTVRLLEEATSWQTENQLPILLNTEKIKAETRNLEKLREMSLKMFLVFFSKKEFKSWGRFYAAWL